MRFTCKILIIIALLINCMIGVSLSQTQTRAGTTTADFLQIGFNSSGNAMGEAQTALAEDVSSIYFNPASLAKLNKNQVQFTYLPWILDINSAHVGAAYVNPRLGNFAVTFFQTSYGAEEVNTVDRQDGTGEVFDGQDAFISLTYARQLAKWFSFGSSAKYINSRIWHESASAVAFDLGALVNTWFFSSTGEPGDGLDIGMNISNYGTRMGFNGIDLKETVDIAPDEEGNYGYTATRLETSQWELPLVARIGFAVHPVITTNHRLTVCLDFIHANNNNEYINTGAQYAINIPAAGKFTLRAGYKGINMQDSQYGLTFGFGIMLYNLGNKSLKLDYSYRDIGLLGNMHTYTVGFLF
ncbi:MAG TPA: PorV/PorQ family protein [bacterium]|nr:PorV/PorQ family protein [bacterium]HPN43529.1 PorV/PorQ family protein [bacterium]